MDIWGTLKSKMGPLPVWVWALLGSALLALILIRNKAKNGNDKAAADQTNSDLGSAAELANMFNIAGLMPYQGGDVYVNTTTTQNPPASPSKPTAHQAHEAHVAHEKHVANEKKKAEEAAHQAHLAHLAHLQHQANKGK